MVDSAGKSGSPTASPDAHAARAPLVLTVDEAAKLLRVNRKTVYDAIARKQLPGVRRLGRTIRIHRQTLLSWLAGQGRVPRSGGNR